MPRIDMHDIPEAIRQRPTEALALGRTVLANDRTLLSFLRTGIGLLGGGIGIVGFVERPLIVVLGWLSIVGSVPILSWGIWRFLKIRQLMDQAASEMMHDKKKNEYEQ